jgi:hypothetical protein
VFLSIHGEQQVSLTVAYVCDTLVPTKGFLCTPMSEQFDVCSAMTANHQETVALLTEYLSSAEVKYSDCVQLSR